MKKTGRHAEICKPNENHHSTYVVQQILKNTQVIKKKQENNKAHQGLATKLVPVFYQHTYIYIHSMQHQCLAQIIHTSVRCTVLANTKKLKAKCANYSCTSDQHF